MTQFYIYIYRDPSRNNEPIYVGKGKGKRAYVHLKRTCTHPFVQRLQRMKRDGVVPNIEIINAMDEWHAFFMEGCCIDVIGRKDLGKGTLLNLTDGGEGSAGAIVSDDTKLKISAQKVGEKNGMFGKKASEETRAKLSQINAGENHPSFGLKRSAITKAKMSAAVSGEKNGMFGKKASEETRLKMSIAAKARAAKKKSAVEGASL